ncbi:MULTISPECIES: acetate/propionate family kinase [Alphaproteobacteria]|uniref:Acetate kinase n=2 Tax=Alphaproteobacteria TaxID=28211 RepID=A0A512HJ67_9HYPH|nr:MULTISPECIES: acetate/propionate family kinase [Alphaproteobacteria]GEO85487.1 acetate kinase [Ciceribacter naphthalenivorans]GLR21491.1 acetate kinase [Ciceribacter naphthalenivorans]GLT04347.1 acetate kinase [Sphingomonas psychrolutea]
MTEKLLLTFNAGSSTVKIGLFLRKEDKAVRIGKGMIDFRHKPLTFHLVEGPEVFDVPLEAEGGDMLHEVLDETFGWLANHFDIDAVTAVGHRVVHGGDMFSGPVLIDDRAFSGIAALTPLAPLHQPQNLRLIEAIRHLKPHLPQTASFDTAFHRSQSPTVQRFAIPRTYFDQGIKRYGFHGLSYKYIAGALAKLRPENANARTVVAHLGSGASICAIEGGLSRDSSMGFSTIDGIPMATRSGALDPGVIFHFMARMGLSREEVEDIVYHKSGLLGLSGISADSRALLESTAQEAREAIDVFTFRIAGEVARLSATLGGLDTLVFTAGIGEHQPAIRSAVCERLAFLGVRLDTSANATNAATISAPASGVAVMVIETDEEQVIADEALSIL